MRNLQAIFLLSWVALLTACFDSEDDEEAVKEALEEEGVGYFIDSPVQGLAYSSPSHTGTTDAFGRFDYVQGETVTFSLGSITLGQATTAKAIHVSDLFDDSNATDPRSINLARLLLSLDTDEDPDNGIQLNATAMTSQENTDLANLTFTNQAFTDLSAKITDYLGVAGGLTNLVSVATAQEHIAYTLSEVEGLLANCGIECVPRAAFNEYVENVTPRHAQTGVSPGVASIVLDMTADYTGDITNTYIEIHGMPDGDFENCRIDWSGFTCNNYTTQTIYDFFQDADDTMHILNSEHVTRDPDTTNKTLTITWAGSLRENYIYTVHVFNDGDSSDEDDYKTWWQFTTGITNPI